MDIIFNSLLSDGNSPYLWASLGIELLERRPSQWWRTSDYNGTATGAVGDGAAVECNDAGAVVAVGGVVRST